MERANGLLMAYRLLSGQDVCKTLHQMAMDHKRRLANVAEAVLPMASALPRHLR